ncbi:hypothetical protein D3C75_126540 [compost metagenome]
MPHAAAGAHRFDVITELAFSQIPQFHIDQRLAVPQRIFRRRLLFGAHRPAITLIEQMRGVDLNIAIFGLDGAGGVDDLTAGIAGRVFLHPQVVARQDVAMLVSDTFRQQLHIATAVQHAGVEQMVSRAQQQIAGGTDKPVIVDIATAQQLYPAPRLQTGGAVLRDAGGFDPHVAASAAQGTGMGQLASATHIDALALEGTQQHNIVVAAQGQLFTCRQGAILGEGFL